jgi:HK97 family phage major capsid protein
VEVCAKKKLKAGKPAEKKNSMSMTQYDLDKLDIKRELDALLAKPHLGASDRKRSDLLLTKMANMRSEEELLLRFDKTIAKEFNFDPKTAPEKRARAERTAQAFEMYLRSGSLGEYRTYAPESTSTAGALIPQQWAGDYLSRLISFSGIREMGATIVNTPFGGPWKQAFSDDAANTGERLDENVQVSLANPTASLNTVVSFRYTAKGIQLSNELVEDIGFDLSSYLQDVFARRIGSVTNSEFTLGASGGPTGVLPAITNIQTSVSPTAVTVSELVGLQAINAAYLPGSVYMFSPGVERQLKSMISTDGLRIFPEMNEKILLGYPYVLNADMPSSFTANSQTVVFGNAKKSIVIRQAAPMLVASRERYAEYYLSYFSLTHRQNCIVTDANGLTVLQQHA